MKFNFEGKNIPHIVLASASPRRSELLSKLGLKFDVEPVFADESHHGINSAKDLVMFLALKKCQAALKCREYANSTLIISADTVVSHKTIMGKPSSLDEAREMIISISGQSHSVFTGVCICNTSSKSFDVFYDETKVFVKKLSPVQIENYIKSDEPYDKAGAYAIQGIFGKYIDHIEGSFENVVGLPIQKLSERLMIHL